MNTRNTDRPLATVALAAAISFTANAGAQTTYAYDDGVNSVLLGPPSSFAVFGDIDVLWGNYFFADPGATFITRIDFGLGSLSQGTTDDVHVWIFNDPDNDANPTNAVPIWTATTTASNLGFDFNTIDVPGVEVSGGFFVALSHLAVLDSPGASNRYPAPVRYDPDARADRSWFFYDSDIPEDDLATSGFVTRMDGPDVPIPGAFAIRATTIETDPCPTDLDRSGNTNLQDLLQLLAAFGTSDAGDTNNDGVTDLTDLLAVLASFGDACP